MKTFFLVFFSFTLCHAQTSLFDGKSLDGWDIRAGEEKWWRVEEGMIVGGSMTEKVPYNTFLSTKKSYENFDLRFRVRMVKGDGFINSGLQLRSTRVPNNSEMSGYQVDVGIGWWGKLYDESRRNRVIGEPVDANAIKAAAKDWDWNDYRILCEGKRIRSWINGVAALDYTEADPKIPTSGLIGLQAHSGGKFSAQFKDITITELPASPKFQGAAPAKMAPIAEAKPRTPEQQQASFHLPPGFSIELVAAEDPAQDIGKFISVSFDQRGRMWTHTALEYPVDANENAAIADALYASKARDKVIIYNREALFDKPLPPGGLKPDHVFADGLAIPLGMLPWGDGSRCIALHGRDIVLLTDTNNDNKADKSEVLLTGFGVQDSHLFPHQFTRAPGGWVWMAQGAFNYSKVKRPQDSDDKAIKFDQTRMARFRPDGSDFEITSNGPCNIWGLVMDRNGETFIQEANDFGYGVMPFHEYANYPGCSNGQWKSYAPEFPATFQKQRFGGTGLSGLCLTDAQGAYPAPYANLMLVANPITNVINTVVMQRDQPSPNHNLTDSQFEKIEDFLTCEDPWFRPIAMTLGPDGCVYIVDWYNKIISHNEVPRVHPDRDKIRGRIWRIKHNAQKPFAVPDFTKLESAALQKLLSSPSLAQTHIAAQTLADRKVVAQDLTLVPALWAGLPSAEQLAAAAASKDPHLRREAARAITETKSFSPALLALRKDADKNVRRETLNTIGYLLEKTTEQEALFHLMLDYDCSALNAPMAPSSRGGKLIPIREAYDREYERYLVRYLLERHPDALTKFITTEKAKQLPVESLLLAALALPPATGASVVAAQLSRLQRSPNDEEVLRLVQAIEQPEIQRSLRAAIDNPATSQTIVDALLKNKNRISPASIQQLIGDTVEKLFQGNPNDVTRGIALSAAFALKDSSEKLHQIALNSADNATRIAALDALATQQSANPIPLTSLLRHNDPDVRISTLKALAASRETDAGAATIAGLAEISAQQRPQIIEILCSHKSGASALVAACLAKQSLKAEYLSNIALDRLQTVLGDDPELKKILAQLGDKYRAVLQLNGKDAAVIPTTITLTGPFTVETWVKLRRGIDNADSLGGAPGLLDLNFAGEQFRLYTGPATQDALTAKKKIVPEMWTHIAAIRDTTGKFKLYINGELDTAESMTVTHPITNFQIGGSTAKGGTDGQFAEYRIWNRERTAEEIRTNFDRSLPTGDAALLFNGSNDQGWGTPTAAATLVRSLDLPPVMSLPQAKAFDEKYNHYLGLMKQPGNAESGKALSALCAACHQFGDSGGNIGPNLSGVGAMGPEAIVRNLLTPNAAIEPGYRIFRVMMKDGSLLDAFFASEDKDAIVIRQMGAGDRRIERKDIASTQFLRQSLMPEGLLDSLSDEQRKDLFTYLMSLK